METYLCPSCHHNEIVPDYLEGELRVISCPHCGTTMRSDHG